jgi:hypothetical protein
MSVSITSSFSGQFAGEYVSAALLSGTTVANGGITVKPNVKYKEVLKTVSDADLITDGSCSFDTTAALTLDERVLEVKNLQVNLELCKTPFEQDWAALEMGFSAFNELPKSFVDFLLAHVTAKVAEATENSIWQGDGTAGQFNGLTTIALADANTNKVTGTTITAANVITEMGKVVDSIVANTSLYGKDDLFIYVSQDVAAAYVRALGGFGSIVSGEGNSGVDAKGTLWYGGGNLSFDGVKVFIANGLPASNMFASAKSNLFMGASLLSDQQEVRVIDMAETDGSKNVRVVMRYDAGVQYGISSDVVIYS